MNISIWTEKETIEYDKENSDWLEIRGEDEQGNELAICIPCDRVDKFIKKFDKVKKDWIDEGKRILEEYNNI